jgi:putative oxidoreductase
MAAFMKPYQAQTFAVLRIVTGLLFFCHGAQKLFGWPIPLPAGMEIPPFIIYVAGPIELVGGLLVAIGLFTSWAAFIASGEMAVAYWIAHGTHAFFPIANQGEPAVIYCFVFLFIAAHGAGIWSVDASRGRG